MKGFDPDFADLPDHIIKITKQIWEGRGVGLIHHLYAEDCQVHTAMDPLAGSEAVVVGTLDTLNALPDRQLLPEDVIWSGDDENGFLSSHRLLCLSHHPGLGVMGPPTGRPVAVRAIADCFCRENQIVEEWLIRDYVGLALQIGVDPVELAAQLASNDQAAGRGPWHLDEAKRLREQANSARRFIKAIQRQGWCGTSSPAFGMRTSTSFLRSITQLVVCTYLASRPPTVVSASWDSYLGTSQPFSMPSL